MLSLKPRGLLFLIIAISIVGTSLGQQLPQPKPPQQPPTATNNRQQAFDSTIVGTSLGQQQQPPPPPTASNSTQQASNSTSQNSTNQSMASRNKTERRNGAYSMDLNAKNITVEALDGKTEAQELWRKMNQIKFEESLPEDQKDIQREYNRIINEFAFNTNSADQDKRRLNPQGQNVTQPRFEESLEGRLNTGFQNAKNASSNTTSLNQDQRYNRIENEMASNQKSADQDRWLNPQGQNVPQPRVEAGPSGEGRQVNADPAFNPPTFQFNS